MFKTLVFCGTIITSLMFLSCSAWLGNDNENLEQGSIVVAVSLGESQNSTTTRSANRAIRTTKHTKLILEILDKEENTLKDTTISADGNLIICDMGKFSAGDALKIIAWTKDDSGVIIHRPDTQTVVVDADKNINIAMILQTRVGSIIARFAGVPTEVDSLFMTFNSDSGAFKSEMARELHSNLSLDNVPYGAQGKLSLKIRRKDQTYLVDWDTAFTFQRENISLEYSFLSDNDDGINISVVTENSFNTIITGVADPKVNFGEEENMGIVVTEFSYNYGNELNFVEISNLSQNELAFEELSVEIIGSSRTAAITNNITLSPQEVLLFANESAKDFWAEQENAFFGNIRLVSTGSIIIIRGNGVILDYVFYSGTSIDNADLLKVPARTSLQLSTLNSNPEINNISSNWNISKNRFVINSNDYYGNPGKPNAEGIE